MKKICFALLCFLFFKPSMAQNGYWTQMNNFGGSARKDAVSFTINNKAYIATGYDGNYKNDLWEYDPANDSWTQKANFPGAARCQAAAFAIGSYGYVGTGATSTTAFTDFWAYNATNNSWTQKANFGGIARFSAVGFSIGTKGYIGAGWDTAYYGRYVADFWEYSPATDTWTQKTSVPFANIGYTSFVIGSSAYVGTGYSNANFQKTDFYRYDQASGNWTTIAPITGPRTGAAAFTIGGKGYVTTGFGGSAYYDIWEYNPLSNIWKQRPSLPSAQARSAGVAFAIGEYGYLATGVVGGIYLFNNVWKFDPATIRITGISKSVVCKGDSLQVNFTINGYNQYMGNLVMQLSDSSGNFTSPVQLVTKFESVGKDSLKGRIPTNILSGSGYRIRIISSTDTSTLSASFKIEGIHVSLFASKPSICQSGDSVTLFANTAAGTQYKWLKNGVLLSTTSIYSTSVFTSGTYKVILLTANACRDTSTGVVITQNAQPVPGFTINNSGQCLKNNLFLFNDTSKITSGSLSRTWQLGTVNDISTATNPARSYTNAGIYSIKLVSVSDKGCRDSVTKQITLFPNTNIGFTINDSDQCLKGNSVTLTNSSSIVSGNYTVKWDLGNGNFSTQTNLSFSYTSAGNYTVQLVTVSDKGCKDTLNKVVKINPHPVAAFTTDTLTCVATPLQMINNSSGNPTAFYWDFGNGDSSLLTNPFVSHMVAGTYLIRLVAQNSFACNDSASRWVNAVPGPAKPSVTALPDTVVCAYTPVKLKGVTNNQYSVKWRKISGGTLTAFDTITVFSPGDYYFETRDTTTHCSTLSDTLQIVHKPAPPQPVITISGSLFTSSAANGNQWYNSSGILAGATGSTYQAITAGQYYTIVTTNGCSSLPSVSMSFPVTGYHQPDATQKFVLYPNPNNGIFTIQCENCEAAHPIRISLSDIYGREIYQQNYRSSPIAYVEIPALYKGLYFILVTQNNNTVRIPIVINK